MPKTLNRRMVGCLPGSRTADRTIASLFASVFSPNLAYLVWEDEVEQKQHHQQRADNQPHAAQVAENVGVLLFERGGRLVRDRASATARRLGVDRRGRRPP